MTSVEGEKIAPHAFLDLVFDLVGQWSVRVYVLLAKGLRVLRRRAERKGLRVVFIIVVACGLVWAAFGRGCCRFLGELVGAFACKICQGRRKLVFCLDGGLEPVIVVDTLGEPL